MSVPPSAAAPLIRTASGVVRGEVYAGIQCLRFMAALLVVVRHATYYTSERLAPGMAVWINGGAGVDIFFIISGFVMMVTADRFANRAGGWRDFALRRLARVVPLYWLATTIKLAAMLLVPAAVLHASLDWNYIVKSYLFVPAYAPDGSIAPLMAVGWTLLFEMFFYGLFTVALGLRLSLIGFCGAVLLLCAAGSLIKPSLAPAYMMYLNPIVLEFLIGMVLARWGTGARLSLAVCTACCVAGGAVIALFPAEGFDEAGLVRAIGPALIVFGTIGLERHVRRFPPALVFLGAASYSLYMVHPLIAPAAPEVLRRLGLVAPLVSVLACIALALAAAVATFLLFERPVATGLGRWLLNPVRRRSA